MNVKETNLLFLKESSKCFAKNGVSRGKNKDMQRKCEIEKYYVKYFDAVQQWETCDRANSKKIQYSLKILCTNN